jgi:serine/threonine-protein kinase
LERSLKRFEEAISADPSSALAHAGLADAYSLLADYGFFKPLEAGPKALAAAENALRLDPDCAQAYVSLAFVRGWFERNWEDADRLYRTALALNPGDSRAHHWYGADYLAFLGHFDEAAAEMERARDLDPLSAIIHEGCGYVQMLRRNYTGALKIYHDLNDVAPEFYKTKSSMGRVFSLMGKYHEAIAAFEQARSLGDDSPSLLGALGQTLAAAGHHAEAQGFLQKLETMSKTQWVPLGCFAVLHLGLGDLETSIQFLEDAAEQRELSVIGLKVHPLYDPLRALPRFDRLLRRLRLLP